MHTLKLGDTLTMESRAMSGDRHERKGRRIMITGKIIYIHPKSRFFVLEAKLPGGKVREAFGC